MRARQVAVLRMLPFAHRITRDGSGRVAVARLRYAVRGWNATGDQQPAPVRDAEWALRQLTERFPGLPIGLIGHSMGGRTAMRIGGHPQVRGIVGLAPWLSAGEPVDQLAGRRVLLMHGDGDRMTSAAATAAFGSRLEAVGASVSMVAVTGDGPRDAAPRRAVARAGQPVRARHRAARLRAIRRRQRTELPSAGAERRRPAHLLT